jgi:hypothetical protein
VPSTTFETITGGPCQVVPTNADRRILSMALTMKRSQNMP